MSRTRSLRTRATLSAAAALLVVAALPLAARAHATLPDGDAVHAGSTAVVHVRIAHGCDGAPVDAVEIALPDGIVAARPEYVPGWGLEVDMVATEPYAMYGETFTERVGVIRWTGGDLPDFAFFDFGFRATFLLEPGAYFIPTVQRCGAAEVAWIETPAEGQDPHDLAYPAPQLTIVPAEAGEGDGH